VRSLSGRIIVRLTAGPTTKQLTVSLVRRYPGQLNFFTVLFSKMIAAALAAEGVTSAQLVRVGQLDAAAGHLGPVPALLHIHVLGDPTVIELHEPSTDGVR